MKIELKGELHPELEILGLKAGDIVDATPSGKVGAMHFVTYHRGWRYDCSVWPDNYTVVKPKHSENE